MLRISGRGLHAFALVLALSLTAPGAAADTVVHADDRAEFTEMPEGLSGDWTRLGDGAAFILGSDGLLINDNSNGENIAYQGYLGRIQAEHRVTVRARVRVLSNIGGDAAILEVARPGLEVRLRLHTGRIDVVERVGRSEFRWLASADVDLSTHRDVTLIKTAASDSAPERIRVEVDGVEVAHCRPLGAGELGVGRIAIGSLTYPGMGASLWKWIEVKLEQVGVDGSSIPVETSRFGQLKGRWSGEG